MLKFKGAHDTALGTYVCSSCGNAMKNWEKMATEQTERGQLYVFRCKKCKKRIEVINDRG